MKKIILALSVACIIVLSGCEIEKGERIIEGERFKLHSKSGDDIGILIDSETGCQYLVLSESAYSGITAHLDINGKPSGCMGVE